MNYLKHKPGSIEEISIKMSNYATESEYKKVFKKELEKSGKGIGAMTPAEKKNFFNKIDSKYTAKNEEDAYENDRYIIKNGKATLDNSNTPDKKNHVYADGHKDAEKKAKEKGIKEEAVKQESMLDAVKSVWQMAAEEEEKKGTAEGEPEFKNPKNIKGSKDNAFKGKADTGSKKTQVQLEPEVDYKN